MICLTATTKKSLPRNLANEGHYVISHERKKYGKSLYLLKLKKEFSQLIITSTPDFNVILMWCYLEPVAIGGMP